ncbi:unnamed protein product [Mytilus coruscus]|uniref:Uncharacterized protein n=1 Tax=Mytilus coruscus TaxID=42192 RepID=A0A6J8F0E7_MYTCO|nr:unnamed protein product [Mytilus coruscus]
MSNPQETLQKYVLTFYPLLFSIVLALAVLAMVISTCFIIFVLCHRKFIRGHIVSSRSEKKSCFLILCVMIIFLLSEVPRIYINVTLVSTYNPSSEKGDIASNKLKTEVRKRTSSCLNDVINDAKYNIELVWDIQKNHSCLSKENSNMTLDWRMRIAKSTSYFFRNHFYEQPISQLWGKIRPDYINYADTYLNVGSLTSSSDRQKLNNYFSLLYCEQGINENVLFSELDSSFKRHIISCDTYSTFIGSLSSWILGHSPFTEPLNYIINITWGHLDISVKNVKLLTEILKLSMIIGCASNFVIYIIMSAKLRDAVNRIFHC